MIGIQHNTLLSDTLVNFTVVEATTSQSNPQKPSFKPSIPCNYRGSVQLITILIKIWSGSTTTKTMCYQSSIFKKINYTEYLISK